MYFLHDVCESSIKKCMSELWWWFVARPIRPTVDRRVGVSLDYQTPSIERVHTKYSMEELKQFSAEVKHIKPEER
jgi:hypothetical protein